MEYEALNSLTSLSFWPPFHLLQPHSFMNIPGIRAFVAVPSAQNAVPLDVSLTQSLASFNSLLKCQALSILFNAEYCHVLVYHSCPYPTLFLSFSIELNNFWDTLELVYYVNCLLSVLL